MENTVRLPEGVSSWIELHGILKPYLDRDYVYYPRAAVRQPITKVINCTIPEPTVELDYCYSCDHIKQMAYEEHCRAGRKLYL